MSELFWFATGFTLGVMFTRGVYKYLAHYEYQMLVSKLSDKRDKKG